MRSGFHPRATGSSSSSIGAALGVPRIFEKAKSGRSDSAIARSSGKRSVMFSLVTPSAGPAARASKPWARSRSQTSSDATHSSS